MSTEDAFFTTVAAVPYLIVASAAFALYPRLRVILWPYFLLRFLWDQRKGLKW
jgi:hypothetical protein